MLTIYAISFSGDILPLSVPDFQTWHAIHPTLAERVCSYDPSRLVLLPALESKSDMEQEEDTTGSMWGLFREWKDGDCISYFVRDPIPFQIRYSHYLCKLEEEYDRTKAPYYTVNVYVEPLNCDRSVYPAECLYRYQFLYSLRDNSFIRRSEFTVDDDEHGPMLLIHRHATRWSSLYEMVESDESIPSHFKQAMYRSVYRKWSETLRSMSRPIKPYPRRKQTSALKSLMEEKKAFLAVYKQFRGTPPPYPRKSE